MQTGTVKWFNEEKGFGFIAGDDGKDIFVHHADIIATGFRKLSEGQRVEYEVTDLNGRQKASNAAVME